MTFDFFNQACALSDQNGFVGSRLDRMGEQRENLDAATLHADPRTRYYALSEARQLVTATDPFNALFTIDQIQQMGGDPFNAYLLGLNEDGSAEFALSVERQEHYGAGIEAVDLRSLTRAGVLVGQDVGAIAQARSLVSWHQMYAFCPRCGAETSVAQAGYARRCGDCDMHHFPRTDPVAIMLVAKDDYCLLGRSPHFPEQMVSCLAGFIEVGETIEDAVRREVFEEAGIQCARVRYHSSQPWPFPSSLMIGCLAEAVSEEIKTDDELEMCRWFSREETRQILENGHPEGFWSPPRMAIAHQLMKSFVVGM